MNKRLVISSIGLCSLLFCAACEGGESNEAPPRLIEGGGIGDGEIDGRVNIYVVDGNSESDDAVTGAKIYIGEAGEDLIEGETDSTGLWTLDDGSLAGATTITVVANGFVSSTWYGANGANVTIPLDRLVERKDFGRATLRGTIDGWADLPEPATNHFIVGVLAYSQTNDLGNPENEIQQPTSGELPPNLCVRVPGVTDCSWSLITRTGQVALSATILDIDNKGTADEGDDTSEVIGFAYKLGLKVEKDVTQSGLALKMLASGAREDVNFELPTAPTGVDSAAILLGLDLGDQGTLMLAYSDIEDVTSLMAPALSGDFVDASYRAYAFASNASDTDEEGRPTTAVLLRDIRDVTSGIEFGDWMDLPSRLTVSAEEFTYAETVGAAITTAEIRDSNNDKVWSMAFLDSRRSFTLPAVGSDSLGSGTFDFIVTAIDDRLNLLDFSIDELSDTIERLATNRVEFTR